MVHGRDRTPVARGRARLDRPAIRSQRGRRRPVGSHRSGLRRGGFAVIGFEHRGERSTLELEAETESTVIDELGTEQGTELHTVPSEKVPLGECAVNIDADGRWKLIVAQPSTPDDAARTLPFEASGNGVNIVGPMKSVTMGEIGSALEYDEAELMMAVYREDPETDTKWMEIGVDGEWHLEVDS